MSKVKAASYMKDKLDQASLAPMHARMGTSDADKLFDGTPGVLSDIRRLWIPAVYYPDGKSAPCIAEGFFMTRYYPQCCATLMVIGAGLRHTSLTEWSTGASSLPYKDRWKERYLATDSPMGTYKAYSKVLVEGLRTRGDSLHIVNINRALDLPKVSHERASAYIMQCMCAGLLDEMMYTYCKSSAMAMSNKNSALHSLMHYTGEYATMHNGDEWYPSSGIGALPLRGQLAPPAWHTNWNGGHLCSALVVQLVRSSMDTNAMSKHNEEVLRYKNNHNWRDLMFPVGQFSGEYGCEVQPNE